MCWRGGRSRLTTRKLKEGPKKRLTAMSAKDARGRFAPQGFNHKEIKGNHKGYKAC